MDARYIYPADVRDIFEDPDPYIEEDVNDDCETESESEESDEEN